MRILILLMFLSAVLLAGCNSQDISNMAPPVASYMQGDENKDCAALKGELAQLKKDIHHKSKEADKKKSGNFLLAAGGCFSIIPWFYMDMEAVENSKADIVALRERYNALLLIANNKGCQVRSTTLKIPGKSDAEKLPMACKYCGPNDSGQWIRRNEEWMCYDCYKKYHTSK